MKAQIPKADSLIRISEKIAKDSVYVRLLNEIAEELSDKDADQSLHFATKAQEQALKIRDTHGLGNALNNIGWAYYRKGDYSKGFDYALRALRINDSLQYLPQLAISYRNVGAIYNSQAKYRESMDYFHKEMSIHTKLNNSLGVGRSLNNIAFSAHRGKIKDSALIFGHTALEYNSKLGDQYLIAFSLRTLGDVYYEEGSIDRSIDYFLASLTAARAAQSNFIIETSLYRLGKAFQQKKQWKESITYLQEAVAVSKILGAKGEQATIQKLLAVSYAQIGDYKKAFESQAIHIALNDTLFEERSRARFAQMQVAFETEKKQAEINLLKQADEAQKEKIRDQRLYTFLLLVVIGLVMALWLVSWRRNQFKQLANKQLRLQKAALEQASFQKDKIFSILSHDLRMPIASLSSVLQLVDKQNISEEAFAKIKHALGKQIASLNTTLDNLLLWSRNQMEGVTDVQASECALYDIVENNCHLLTSAASQKRIVIQNEVSIMAKAYVDVHHIDIILRNLLLNALKFTEEGGSITVQSREEEQEVTLDIIDTGIGMSEEQIGKLFKINTHFTTTGTKNEKGAGLGLLLCKEFVEANHGKLSVKSEPGNGSQFSVTLPKSKYV
ncbi:MAG: tetratricopeptide repeat protein [Chitinophagaceae bacterium]|nr:tetratricopeptide repeat protein [Chitinophagaceae bacterium]